MPAAVVVELAVAPDVADVLGCTMMEVGTDAEVSESVAVGKIVCGEAGESVLDGSTVLGGGFVGVPVMAEPELPLLTGRGVAVLSLAEGVPVGTLAAVTEVPPLVNGAAVSEVDGLVTTPPVALVVPV